MLFEAQIPQLADPPEEHSMAMRDFDIDAFLSAARQWRPAGYDEKMKRRQRFLESDICEADLLPELKRHYPETWREMVPVVKNLVPLVVNERAKAFKRSKFRLARRGGEELPDDDEQAKLFERVWREAQMQIRLEELNRYAENSNTCFLRVAWDPQRKRLKPQVFQPQHVQVIPNPDDICDLDSAVGVALRVASDTGIVPEPGRERWEFWSREHHFIALGDGQVLPPAPDNPQGVNPYDLVPVVAFLAQPPDKGLFTLAGEDLIAEALAQSAAATDLDFIGKHQGFGEIFISADTAGQKELQTEKLVRSPNIIQTLPKNTSAQLIQPNPMLSQLNEVGKDRLKHTALLHGLPAGSVLSEARTVAAAEALAIERISLEEYREESVARYREAVERLWHVVRAVWNARAPSEGLPAFEEDLELVWYPGDLSFRSANVPTTAPDMLTVNEWRRRLGEGPARLEDGSLDPDGDVLIYKLRQRASTAAAGASIGTRLGSFSFGGTSAGGSLTGAASQTSGPMSAREPPAAASALGAGEGGAARPATAAATQARPAAAEPRAADTALNGAQVQSAAQIVKDVAAGQLPRESGVAMLQVFFRLAADEAEQIMGDVGRGFEPKPEPTAAPAPKPAAPPKPEQE